MRRTGFVLLILSATVGCELDPDALLLLAGRVRRAGGAPWAQAPLVLSQQAPESAATAATSSAYVPWREVSAAQDGTFLVELRGRDLAWENGAERRLELHLPEVDEGKTAVRFQMQGGDNRLPPVQPWAAGLQLEEGAGSPRLLWNPAPWPALEGRVAYTVRLRVGGEPLWVQEGGAEEGLSLPDVFEDLASPEVVVEASVSGARTWYPLNGQSADLAYTFSWESRPLSLSVSGSPPLSRGADCAYPQVPAGPCLLTDGRMEAVALSEDATEISLVLPVATTLERAVLRGLRLEALNVERTIACPDALLIVEGTLDSERWVELARIVSRAVPQGGEHFVEAAWSQAGPAARVRIHGVCASWPARVVFRSAREISLY